MTKDNENDFGYAVARLFARQLALAYQIREDSYVHAVPETPVDGHYTKDWEQCAAEAGIHEAYHPLVPLLMHWSNDVSDWVQGLLGYGLDGTN